MSDTDVNDDSRDRYTVPALERGLRLLCQFNRNDRALGAPELARRLDLPRSTVFRMLNTLEHMGFVRKTDGGSTYQLDMGVLRLGFEYLASLELTELGRPLLERVRDATGYSSNLVVLDQHWAVVVAKSSAPTPFVSTVYVGTRLPAHATLLGRALLCDLSLDALRKLYGDAPLQSYSPRTPDTVEALHEVLQQDRARGYVSDHGFYEAAVASIAAPVRDRNGATVAALGVTIPTMTTTQPAMDEAGVIATVRSAADELSRLLDYAPPGATR